MKIALNQKGKGNKMSTPTFIQLNKTWRLKIKIGRELVNVDLQREMKTKDKETGKTNLRYIPIGYYSCVESGLRGFLRHYPSEASSFDDIKDKIQEVYKIIAEIFDFEIVIKKKVFKND